MLILNQAQAEAVYSAMCHLNNICGKMDAAFPSNGETIVVQELECEIIVKLVDITEESYPNQAAFAAAYGLDLDA